MQITMKAPLTSFFLQITTANPAAKHAKKQNLTNVRLRFLSRRWGQQTTLLFGDLTSWLSSKITSTDDYSIKRSRFREPNHGRNKKNVLMSKWSPGRERPKSTRLRRRRGGTNVTLTHAAESAHPGYATPPTVPLH